MRAPCCSTVRRHRLSCGAFVSPDEPRPVFHNASPSSLRLSLLCMWACGVVQKQQIPNVRYIDSARRCSLVGSRLIFAGSIPPELGNLVALEELHLASNELTGECGLLNVCVLINRGFHSRVAHNLTTINSSLSLQLGLWRTGDVFRATP